MYIDECLIAPRTSCVVLTYEDYKHFKEQGIIGRHNYIGDSYTTLADNKRSLNKRYKLKSIQIGNAIVPDVIATFPTSSDGIKSRIIGLELLQRFTPYQ